MDIYKSTSQRRWTHKQAAVTTDAQPQGWALNSAWPHQHCGPSWLFPQQQIPFQQIPSSLPIHPIPQTLHRGEGVVLFRLHLATTLVSCTVLEDLSEHHWEPTATSLEVTTGIFLPPPLKPGYWDINWNIDYKPGFLQEKRTPCTVISRPARNYRMECDHCSGSLVGRTLSLSV